jgi:serine/threonine-protein kinase
VVQVFDFGRVGDAFRPWNMDGLTCSPSCAASPQRTNAFHLARRASRPRNLAGLAHSLWRPRQHGTPLRIIHRDLSPANVLLSKNGEVKISDFGVARVLSDAGAAQTQSVAGHAGYMAPEQAKGDPFDERCDLFGLGVVLWELFAGRRLFQREPDRHASRSSEPIPKLTVPARSDPLGCLLRKPSRATPPSAASATEMAEGLDRMQRPGGVATPTSWRLGRTRPGLAECQRPRARDGDAPPHDRRRPDVDRCVARQRATSAIVVAVAAAADGRAAAVAAVAALLLLLLV